MNETDITKETLILKRLYFITTKHTQYKSIQTSIDFHKVTEKNNFEIALLLVSGVELSFVYQRLSYYLLYTTVCFKNIMCYAYFNVIV